jgi:hypothetical protein
LFTPINNFDIIDTKKICNVFHYITKHREMHMRRLNVFMIFALALAFTQSAQAGAKDDFIKAVVSQCGKSEADAGALATPGRSGNVIKYKTCSGASIQVGDCTLQCKDASSNIGG